MGIRAKILSYMTIISIVMIMGFYLISSMQIMKNALQVEVEQMDHTYDQINEMIKQDLANLTATIKDWAYWDDTFNFLKGENDDYIERNLQNDTFIILGLDVIIFIDLNGQIFRGLSFDHQNELTIPYFPEFDGIIQQIGSMIPDYISNGIIYIDKKPMIIASCKVTKSNDDGLVAGSLLLGKFIDEEFISKYQKISGAEVSYIFPGSEKFTELKKLTTAKSESFSLTRDNNVIDGYYMQKDIFGADDQAILRITLPRTSYNKALQSLNFYTIAIIFFGLIIFILVFLFLKIIIIERLVSLHDFVNITGKRRNLSDRAPVSGKDEISGLASGINLMLSEISEAESELRYLSYHDKMTGLFNRTYFEESLKQQTRPFTIILGDLNGLKVINELMGYEAGDHYIKTISSILLSACGENAIVARYSGGEFAIILPDKDTAKGEEVLDGEDLCTRIKAMCDAYYYGDDSMCPIGDKVLKPSIAFGYAIASLSGYEYISVGEITTLMKTAEDRMCRDKLLNSRSMKFSIISSLEQTLAEKNLETEEHTRRLQSISSKVGRAAGLNEVLINELALLSALHDIGKVGIPDQILMKNTSLSDVEWETMKKHPEIGSRIAESSSELAHISAAIRHHHERFDGKGYPYGLAGDQIPVIDKILSIVDAYDVMTNGRVYKKAMTHEEAIFEIRNCSGTQFDPIFVNMFIEVMEIP
ncbi:MAG: CHASE4 domain-containing protein [Clostridiales bacterium]|nr:CHASE4 domain-containing protein [Clostridiales bacterium]